MYRSFILSLIISAICYRCFSQEMKEVYGEYTYYATESTSIEEAKRIALERAKIQAIADAFGTQISQNSSTTVSVLNNKSDSRFFMMGTSEIKGEWIETIGQPTFSIVLESQFFIVNCKVNGKVREILQPDIDIEVATERNGVTKYFG